ncbi:MAG TPA: FAD-binding protein, partial [Thermodesulfobacteriota bacterium]|nr:FAD-binding protein [Thermodesulfobacteriota bacterium]
VRSVENWPNDMVARTQQNLLVNILSCRTRMIRLSPVSHFSIGGVATDVEGATGVPGLFAAGEIVGGLHGANRLGGNALSEILVFGFRAGKAAGDWALRQKPQGRIEEWGNSEWESLQGLQGRRGNGPGAARLVRKHVAGILWDKAGISRDEAGLRSALDELAGIGEKQLPRVACSTPKEMLEKMETGTAILVGEMIARSALLRQESRGVHFRRDFPRTDDAKWKGNVFLKKADDGMHLEFRPLAPERN